MLGDAGEVGFADGVGVAGVDICEFEVVVDLCQVRDGVAILFLADMACHVAHEVGGGGASKVVGCDNLVSIGSEALLVEAAFSDPAGAVVVGIVGVGIFPATGHADKGVGVVGGMAGVVNTLNLAIRAVDAAFIGEEVEGKEGGAGVVAAALGKDTDIYT